MKWPRSCRYWLCAPTHRGRQFCRCHVHGGADPRPVFDPGVFPSYECHDRRPGSVVVDSPTSSRAIRVAHIAPGTRAKWNWRRRESLGTRGHEPRRREGVTHVQTARVSVAFRMANRDTTGRIMWYRSATVCRHVVRGATATVDSMSPHTAPWRRLQRRCCAAVCVEAGRVP